MFSPSVVELLHNDTFTRANTYPKHYYLSVLCKTQLIQNCQSSPNVLRQHICCRKRLLCTRHNSQFKTCKGDVLHYQKSDSSQI